MLVSKNTFGPNAKLGRPNAKPGRPNASPNVGWWNIVCVWYARVCFTFAMYTFHVVCVNFVHVGYLTQMLILVEYGLKAHNCHF